MKLTLAVIAIVLGWTTFAGNSSRSFETETPVWPPFSVKWSINLGPPGTRVASPVTFEKVRIVKYIRRDEGQVLHIQAFDDSGKVRWHYKKDLGTKVIFAINSKDFEGSPTIAANMIFFTTTKTLIALSFDEGKLLWEYEYQLRDDQDISTSCPLVYGDKNQTLVVVPVVDKVFIHDGYNGKLLSKTDNISETVPPVLLSGQSTLSPVHIDNNGKKLAQLPPEALRQKGGFATSGDLSVAYYLNACWKAWRFDRRYNRWDKAWTVEDKSKQPSPFWSYRHANITGDRIILSMPKKLVCVDLQGKTLWEYESPICQWNQSVPVAGNVALLTCFVHSRMLQPIDIRDGLLYDQWEMPVFPMAPPVPTVSGFMVVSTGASLWEFSSAAPPKASISANQLITIYKDWAGFEFPVNVKNVGGSRMTFTAKSEEAEIDGTMTRCNPGSSKKYKTKLKRMAPQQRVSFVVDGDGGMDSITVYITASDTLPDPRDVNLDGKIDNLDVLEVLLRLGRKASGKPWELSQRSDVNGDGMVGLADLIIVGGGTSK